ncbi:MAG: glycoside hydrolase family 2, partial [Clostridia bacterium]|nr:glycoside hydrolase family 2 [Clostridia bacterium]
MKSVLFQDGWTCRHLDEAGEGVPVRIPDDAMLREKRSDDALGGLNVSWFEGFDYRYEKRFTLEDAEAKKHHVLEFEGVYRCAEVSVNGKKAGFRPYGYTNFYVDCDEYLTGGENTVEVIARNADQPNSRWYSGAGIYRPVRLWSSEPDAYIELNGVKIKTLSLDPAMIEVSVLTKGEGSVQVEILDGDTVIAMAASEKRLFTLSLPGAKPWSVESPKRYLCRVSFRGDEAEETFGLRTIAWGRDGFKLNGKRVILRGACVHHDNGLLGAACDPDALERRIRILKENGYNALRSAHNPCSKTALEICDRLGMLVMDEYIDHWYIHKTMHDYVEHFDTWWKQDLHDMVDKDYNHPCVILYSTGNEVAETAQPRGIQLTKDMTEYLHFLDASRPVTCGINIFFNFLNAIGFGQYSDEKAAKEAERNARAKAEGKKTKESATGSKFFNDLAGIMGADFMKIGATLHGSDVHTREAFANMDIAGYNYGEKRYQKDLKKYPDRL